MPNESSHRLFLLADDDADDADLFSEALERNDPSIEFYHVESGPVLFDYLGYNVDRKPDIIFLDLNMPEMSGLECLSLLKGSVKYKDIPVILYSTLCHPKDEEKAMQSGAAGILTKPVDFNQLLHTLDRIATADTDHLNEILQAIAQE